ncbi:uncharacterized protein E0L32_005799 [Thyridium curvatum]|uniref:4-coumarate--CoA ligase n=1 Tax=Thyridium curvatum TaxID=1093900 RepID=A0A507ASS6_9PEZI|nr:uncharacterized protein E0L32_005799 [Thyridium curvatum]TPX13855.1 hypothetical protein E0L32_005799 [Thyridium curvatum]
MPIQSRWTTPVPEVSLQKWVFGSSFGRLTSDPVFIDADRPQNKVTYSDFRLWSKRVALGLQRCGLQNGDRVLLFSGNHILFPSVFMGVVMAGGIFTGASPAFTANELAYQLSNSGAFVLIAAPQVLDIAVKAAEQAKLPKERLFVLNDPNDRSQSASGVRSWMELLANNADAEKFDWVEPLNPCETTCCLNYSSGTTGAPKGVEITHYSYVANGEASLLQHRLNKEATRDTSIGAGLCFLPLYHAAGQTTYAVNHPRMGMPVYVMPAFNFERMLQHIQNYGISSLGCAPPIVRALAKSPLPRKYDLSSVSTLTCGTAPLAPELAIEVEKLWPRGSVFVKQGWGMTELTCVGTIMDPAATARSDSVGEMVPNATFKLMDGDREVTEANKRGELWFSGPTVMKGYWRNPKATQDTIEVENGTRWLKTGDIAYVDSYGPGGMIHIVDRIKELLKVKGFQVAPAELEAVLLERKDVLDAGVVGVKIDGEEVPRAYIIKSPDSKATEADIQKWMESKVAKYKRLTGGVVFTDNIPRVPSGKILRRVLKERAQAELAKEKRPAKLS